MIRAVLVTSLCAALVGLSPSVRAAAQDRTLLLAQLPPPGPPGPGWPGAPPGWPGPAPGPQWLAHEQQCEGLQQHLAQIRHAMRHSPPPMRQQLAVQAAGTRERLRVECWGS
jgi:hypothetical protein